jgi:hypothetical protein
MEELEKFSIQELRENKKFLERIRWDITPKIWFNPPLKLSGNKKDNIDSFMFYVDIVYDKPALVIIKNKVAMSKTVGYVENVPENLLLEAMNCAQGECIAGMYPITKRLEDWLKKELGLSIQA